MRSSVLVLFAGGFCATAAILLANAPRADACTPPACTGGELREADATIPANAEGIVWAPKVSNRNNSEETVDASTVSLTRSDDGTQIPVQVSASTSGPDHYIVTPEGGFDPNTTYEFNGDAFCDWDGEVESHDHYTTTFSTAGAAPEIESIGTFRLEDSGYGEMSTGGCLGTVGQADQRELRLRLSDAAQQWSDAFFYRVQSRPEGVDDFGPGRAKPILFDPEYERAPGPTSSVVSTPFRGAFLYKMCEFDGESAGDGESETWDVRMKVSHPPTSQTWTTNSVSITLECPDQSDGGDEVGVDTGPDAGADTGADVGPGVGPDVGSDTGGDLGSDGGPPRFETRGIDQMGCGCSTGDSRVPVGGALVFFVGTLALVRLEKS